MNTIETTGHCCCCCGKTGLAELGWPAAWPGVTSDCRPWPRLGRLATCRACGHVQKIADPAWLGDIVKIYGNYDMYHLSGGVEQVVFYEKDILTKSARLLACLQEYCPLPERGRLLDVGCGNGSLLRSFQALRPRWQLEGTEQGKRFEPLVRKIPGVVNFHTGPLASLQEKYDLITLMNVFEHVNAPLAILCNLRPLLAENGKVLIQAPNLLENPFDLMVVDHRSHFVPATLAHAARSMGYQCLALRTAWIAKEISLILAPEAADNSTLPVSQSQELDRTPACDVIAWLQQCVAHASSLAAEYGPRKFGIFGTVIAGTWLAGILGQAFSFFVDEDPYKLGKSHIDRPILSPAQAPAGSCVYLAFPAPIAAKVAVRLNGLYPHLRLGLPPAMKVVVL